MNWECIHKYGLEFRAKVQGGWIVKVLEPVVHMEEYNGMVDGWDFRVAITFVPDPDYLWEIDHD